MNDRDRLEQLRALLVRLERMPVSAERDWMVREVRARAVDVETGVKPAAMRARSADGAQAEIPLAPKASRTEAAKTVAPPKPRRAPASRRPAARAERGGSPAMPATPGPRSSLAVAGRRPAQESVVDLLEQGGVLSLDDQPARADAASRSWSGGLRG
jgi:hypothetical protein